MDTLPDGMSVNVDVQVDHHYCHIEIEDVEGGVRVSVGATPAASLTVTLDEVSADELTALLTARRRPHPAASGRTAGCARLLARRLARRLRRAGALRTPPWWEVVEYTERHQLVPCLLFPAADGTWSVLESASEHSQRWLDAVYSDTSLVTDVVEIGGSQVPVVGDERPSRILSMLEHLEVEDDNGVVEVGAGAGYCSALLRERVGCSYVRTVDVDGRRLSAVRERLDRADYAPVLTELLDSFDVVGGEADRLISHFAVLAIPRSWILPLEGMLITEFAPVGSPGHAVVLHCRGDSAEGRFVSGIPLPHCPSIWPIRRVRPGRVRRSNRPILRPGSWSHGYRRRRRRLGSWTGSGLP